MERNQAKPYHIDYCFVSEELYHIVKQIEVSIFEDLIIYYSNAN
jgi:hypothetical protein